MAGLTTGQVQFIEDLMIQVPILAVDIMHSVRSVGRERKPAPMASCAFDDRSFVALQLLGRNVVVRIGIAHRPFRMSTTVTGLTRHASVAQTVSI